MTGYLLDTNHCSKILKRDAAVLEKVRSVDEEQVFTCVIVQGELFYMVSRSAWKGVNRANVLVFMNNVGILEIDQGTTEIYGEMKAIIMNHYAPLSGRRPRNFKFPQTGISDNDLWIAAIAFRNGLTILSKDKDFQKMLDAGIDISVESWI